MTYRIPQCPASYMGNRCQLDAGHDGDHLHTTEHANAYHTVTWNNTSPDHTHGWRRK